MDSATIRYYEENAAALASKYAYADVSTLHVLLKKWIRPGSRVLEIGCGCGRDAAFVASLGCSVLATDASARMLSMVPQGWKTTVEYRHAAFPLASDDPLLRERFDVVAAIGVLMHIPDGELPELLCQLSNMLHKSGLFICSTALEDVRTDDDERLFVDRDPLQLQLLLQRFNLSMVSMDSTPDSIGRPFAWITQVFRVRAADGMPTMPQIVSIVTKERHTTTYKLAFMRALCDIALQEQNQVQAHFDDAVSVPLGMIVERWIRYYWALFDAPYELPEIRTGSRVSRLAFCDALRVVMASFGEDGVGAFVSGLQTGTMTPQQAAAFSTAASQIAEAIIDGPLRHIGASIGQSGCVFSYHGARGSWKCTSYRELVETFGQVRVPYPIWKELTVSSYWIREASILRWAAISSGFTNSTVAPSQVLRVLRRGSNAQCTCGETQSSASARPDAPSDTQRHLARTSAFVIGESTAEEASDLGRVHEPSVGGPLPQQHFEVQDLSANVSSEAIRDDKEGVSRADTMRDRINPESPPGGSMQPGERSPSLAVLLGIGPADQNRLDELQLSDLKLTPGVCAQLDDAGVADVAALLSVDVAHLRNTGHLRRVRLRDICLRLSEAARAIGVAIEVPALDDWLRLTSTTASQPPIHAKSVSSCAVVRKLSPETITSHQTNRTATRDETQSRSSVDNLATVLRLTPQQVGSLATINLKFLFLSIGVYRQLTATGIRNVATLIETPVSEILSPRQIDHRQLRQVCVALARASFLYKGIKIVIPNRTDWDRAISMLVSAPIDAHQSDRNGHVVNSTSLETPPEISGETSPSDKGSHPALSIMPPYTGANNSIEDAIDEDATDEHLTQPSNDDLDNSTRDVPSSPGNLIARNDKPESPDGQRVVLTPNVPKRVGVKTLACILGLDDSREFQFSHAPITVLNLTPGISSALEDAGVNSVGQLVECPVVDLLALRSVGPQRLYRVCQAIKALAEAANFSLELPDKSMWDWELSTLTAPIVEQEVLAQTALGADDDISMLKLTAGSELQLRAHGINTVGELAKMNAEELRVLPRIGPTRALRVLEALASYPMVEDDLEAIRQEQMQTILSHLTQLNRALDRIHALSARRFIRMSLPLPRVIQSTLEALAQSNVITLGDLIRRSGAITRQVSLRTGEADARALATILRETTALAQDLNCTTVTEELQSVLGGMLKRDYQVLAWRNTPSRRRTLEEIGKEWNLSRERVRQMEKKAINRLRVRLDTHAMFNSALALGILDAMESNLRYNDWVSILQEEGMVSDEKDARTLLMIARAVDTSPFAVSARCWTALSGGVSPSVIESKKTILSTARSACRQSGVVRLESLRSSDASLADIEIVLSEHGYRRVADGWWHSPGKSSVLTKTALKMIHVCGPLSPAEIKFGARKALLRTGSPAPPSAVVHALMLADGSFEEHDGAIHIRDECQWRPKPTGPEQVFITLVNERGPVVRFETIHEEVTLAGYSLATTTSLLRYSPLVRRVGRALYTSIGCHFDSHDLESARLARSRASTPANLIPRSDGVMELAVTVAPWNLLGGIIGSGTGATSLQGEWILSGRSDTQDRVHVRKGFITGLLPELNRINAVTGDRIVIEFNTWTRTASLRKADESE